MTTLNVRIEEKIKVRANKALAKVGLDMSSAVKIFLHQVIVEEGLPFTPTSNRHIIRARWDKEFEEATKTGKSYKNVHEMHRDILK
jgi:DNA-damage-inducible protein J